MKARSGLWPLPKTKAANPRSQAALQAATETQTEAEPTAAVAQGHVAKAANFIQSGINFAQISVGIFHYFSTFFVFRLHLFLLFVMLLHFDLNSQQ